MTDIEKMKEKEAGLYDHPYPLPSSSFKDDPPTFATIKSRSYKCSCQTMGLTFSILINVVLIVALLVVMMKVKHGREMEHESKKGRFDCGIEQLKDICMQEFDNESDLCHSIKSDVCKWKEHGKRHNTGVYRYH